MNREFSAISRTIHNDQQDLHHYTARFPQATTALACARQLSYAKLTADATTPPAASAAARGDVSRAMLEVASLRRYALAVVDPDAITDEDRVRGLQRIEAAAGRIPGVRSHVVPEIQATSLRDAGVAMLQSLAPVVLRLVAVLVYHADEVPAIVGRDANRTRRQVSTQPLRAA